VVSWASVCQLVVKLVLPWVSRDFRGTPQERSQMNIWEPQLKPAELLGKEVQDYCTPRFWLKAQIGAPEVCGSQHLQPQGIFSKLQGIVYSWGDSKQWEDR